MKYLLIISILFILASCGKKNQIKVTAKNAATGEGYAGLEFRIYKIRPYTTPTGEIQDLVYEGTFNQNGEAIAEMRIRKNLSYVITTESPGPMCYINNTQYSFGSNDDNLKFDFRFAECAYLKINVHNVDCQDSNDRILFDFKPTYIDNYSNIIPREEFGCYSNEFISSEVPYGLWKATWEVTKNGSTTHFDSLFYINQGEQYIFEINY